MAHAATLCDACGQVDDHPKLHYGAETYHHDCLPHKVVRDLTTTGFWRLKFGTDDEGNRVVVGTDWVDGEPVAPEDMHPHVARALAIRDAALSGVRGESLREHIVNLHADQPTEEV